MPDPPSQDDALLARLNALKKSSVSFSNTSSSSIVSSSPPSKTSAPDDLAARFARLGSASPSSSPRPSRTATSSENKNAAPVIAPGAPSYLEGLADGVGGSATEANFEDEKSIEELLGELGPQEDWDVSRGDERDVGKLLKDIRSILPEVQASRKEEASEGKEGLADWENVEVDVGSGEVSVEREKRDEDEGEGEGVETEKKKSEEEEADDVIARVMTELAISKKYDPPSPPNEDDHSDAGDEKAEHQAEDSKGKDGNDAGLSLPSAPTSFPQDDFDRTQAIEDALTARLAALSSPSQTSDAMGLPSAPSFSPAKKPPKVQSTLASKLDQEIETWCIICSDDATLKCLGHRGQQQTEYSFLVAALLLSPILLNHLHNTTIKYQHANNGTSMGTDENYARLVEKLQQIDLRGYMADKEIVDWLVEIHVALTAFALAGLTEEYLQVETQMGLCLPFVMRKVTQMYNHEAHLATKIFSQPGVKDYTFVEEKLGNFALCDAPELEGNIRF
ncbi:hypothetical protein N0V90_006324 [Kalmusia sp. IMI 367209]|nr:hypothetical protein N0V90_006324 [Kalmusia sp. IMI 367209]